MTNEQFAVVLRAIAAQLDGAIEQARGVLPIEAFVGKTNPFGGMFGMVDTIYSCPALQPLENLLDQIETSANLLIKEDTNG